MKRIFSLLLLVAAATATTAVTAAERPRLVVNMVISSMRAGDLDRYAAHFGEGGFNRLTHSGAYYTEGRYDFRQTLTPVTLTTLSTGAQPSMHGIVSESWYDYSTMLPVALTDGTQGDGGYHLIASTLAETLRLHSPESHTFTLAMDPASAITLGGRTGDVYWINAEQCEWTTSPYYTTEQLPWIRQYNREGGNIGHLLASWKQLIDPASYRNTRYEDIRIVVDAKRGITKAGKGRLHPRTYYERLRYTPAGNSAVLGFATEAVRKQELGKDEVPDLLNICLDVSRHLTEAYGPESVEVEDMYYRLDRDLEAFLAMLDKEVGKEHYIVLLTSDHGTSTSFDLGKEETERFRPMQFRVIANGFLNMRYGSGNWILGFRDGSLFLDHNLIYERNLHLSEVQNEVANFAMQFSGVSHALSANDLQSTYFGGGFARRIQNSYYPRRSGDVILNLQPGWVEERENIRSHSGSMYGYDTQVPLVLYGAGIAPARIDREVDMTSAAPTLALLLGVPEPEASEGTPLKEITE